MAGHLFVVQGDIKQLACDAWLLPTDKYFSVSEWFADAVNLPYPSKLEGRHWQGKHLQSFVDWIEGQPWIWLGNVGRTGKPAEWYAARAAEFVETLAKEFESRDAAHLQRRLLAVNVLGSGHGGHRAETGELQRELIPVLADAASQNGVDVVLVAWGRKAYSAAQRIRRNLIDDDRPIGAGWADLTPELLEAASALAGRARLGELVLFLGAGVSVGAGLPLWQKLIDDLASATGMSEPDLKRLRGFDLRDQAAVIARRRKESETELRKEVAESLTSSRYSLTHGLLASIGAGESVTTNYDELFEMACQAGEGSALAVLPYEAVQGSERWLLKLHGSVKRDESITLTRDDYQALAAKYGALFGLVQALLAHPPHVVRWVFAI